MFKQHDAALAIVGLAIDFETGSDAALFWHDLEQGALSRASQAANLPPERVRALVEAAQVDANLGGIELPVFLVGRPGMLSDAGLQGCECATVAACLNRALGMAADLAVIGVCGRGGVMFAVHKPSENKKNVAGA